jgi:hypothetical protein
MVLVSESMSEMRDTEVLAWNSPNPSERRRGLRIRQNRPIKIFEPTTQRYYGGQTEDLSATGLRIELPLNTPMRPGRIVNVHVGLGRYGECLANRRKMMPARIIWVNREPDLTTGLLTAGIEFIANLAVHLDAA